MIKVFGPCPILKILYFFIFFIFIFLQLFASLYWFTLFVPMSSSYIKFGSLFRSPLQGPLRMSLITFMFLPLSVIDLELILSYYTRSSTKHESASARARGKHPMVPETETNPAQHEYFYLFGSQIFTCLRIYFILFLFEDPSLL